MHRWLFSCCLFLLACGITPEKEFSIANEITDTTPAESLQTAPYNNVEATEYPAEEESPPAVPVTKSPSGVYRFLLPRAGGKKLLQTIAFYPGTFRLQEEFTKDSIVITEGTWAPSRGFIWLYKGQVVRGRYTWQGDTLQYYSPDQKEMFPMQKTTSIWNSQVWQAKKNTGGILYGVGTEPFWSVEITNKDSVVLTRPDWNEPVRLKVTQSTAGADSTVFGAFADSVRVTVYPYFCSDGMSDFLYSRRIKIEYKGQTFSGCGELLQTTH